MFTVECAFRSTLKGVEFRLDDDPPEDEMCELRPCFAFGQFYAPERDNGSGLTWSGGMRGIEFRALGEPWRHLDLVRFMVARKFLERHCRKDLDEVEREAALETYYGR